MTTTGIQQGRPERKPRIEEGLIKEVDLDRGYCVVDTASGRTLDEVRIASPMGGDVGLQATPMPDTSCLVLYYLPDALQHAYLLSTFRQPDGDRTGGDLGAPGDLNYTMNAGGHALFTQSGLIDLKSDPGLRLSMLPGDQLLRGHMTNRELFFSPLSHERHLQGRDGAFYEFMMSSTHLREEVPYPDIIHTLGDQSITSDGSPESVPAGTKIYLYITSN